MQFRRYDHARDADAAHRIWRETGWIEGDDTKSMDEQLTNSRSHVADVNGEPECLVMTQAGTVRHLDTDIPMGCVTAVTTSHLARGQGLASRLTARAIAEDVQEGAAVSTLGMFEQGFYDKLGFGSGGYVHRFAIDPSSLLVEKARRAPRRLGLDDLEAVYRNRIGRRKHHGAVCLLGEARTRAELLDQPGRKFGYGYFDDDGTLTHQIWFHNRGDIENGPYSVDWMAWQTRAHFLELMGLVRNLADQVRLVYVRESHGIQLQDLVRRPIHHRMVSANSEYDARMRVIAYWQTRINDLPACMQHTHLHGAETLRFNLDVRDPIAGYLPADAPWRGIGGVYHVTLGPESAAETGTDPALPTLRATVNAFTRLWLGVRSATALNITDELEAPQELLRALDRHVCLPTPEPDWDY